MLRFLINSTGKIYNLLNHMFDQGDRGLSRQDSFICYKDIYITKITNLKFEYIQETADT